MTTNQSEIDLTNQQLQQTPIAIVGMASIFPQAKNLQEYWENIVNEINCITDVPDSRWNLEDYYDPDPRTPDKTYCKRGGFIPHIDFNPMEFGIPPNLLEVTDISQLLSLVVAKKALEDSGYVESREFNRERTGVILGVAAGRQLAVPYGARMQYPIWQKALESSGISAEEATKIVEKIKQAYADWDTNSFPGLLSNVVAGRIANRFDLGAMNCVVDAACASSLAALSMAVSELTARRADMMLTGGVDTDNSIFAYLCFSKTPAVSPSQNVRSFDADSDGMMLGEGLGIMVLKRLEDAERDGDRIYAVITGIGSSSDGRYNSIYAPRPEGQMKALRRAYEAAGIAPADIGLIEAHGTGTPVGDKAEFAALKEVFQANEPQQSIALGSVKSQIGHTKAAAGAASLIKTALALHHKTLPPTINITKPNPKLQIESSAFYLNTQTRPWFNSGSPRRAGVSSFGFGGSNYHVVLEEYQQQQEFSRLNSTPQPVLISADTPVQLLAVCDEILQQLQGEEGKQHYQRLIEASKSCPVPHDAARVGFVVKSLTETCQKIKTAIALLKQRQEAWEHPQGIYYRPSGLELSGKVVALFSGQGSQYLEMGRELAINFPCMRKAFECVGKLASDASTSVAEVVFPPPTFDSEIAQTQNDKLQRTEYAQPAIGAFSAGVYKILQQAGFKPDFVAGHSFGELTALWAAGVLSDRDYFSLVKARGEAMASPTDAGSMMAVTGDISQVQKLLADFPEVTIANLNSPKQVVLAGNKAEVSKLHQLLTEKGYSAFLLPVSAAFHTQLVAHAQKPFAEAISSIAFNSPTIPVYTNVTGKSYPTDSQTIKTILQSHLLNRVLFQQEIENIYADGGYCFVEFGPRRILTNLVQEILGDRHHIAIAVNGSRQKDSDLQLREAVIQLRVAGLSLENLDPYQRTGKIPQTKKNKALNLRLTGVNYVSEKTKKNVEEALGEKPQVAEESNGEKIKSKIKHNSPTFLAPQSTSIASGSNDMDLVQLQSDSYSKQPNSKLEVNPLSNGHNGKDNDHATAVQLKTGLQTENKVTSTVSTESKTDKQAITKARNPLPVLNSLENRLQQFEKHQIEICRVHEQYLNQQQEYTKIVLDVVQQQNALFVNDNFIQQPEETRKIILESSDRSLNKLHEHQGKVLNLHKQYIDHQVEYAVNFLQATVRGYAPIIETPEVDANSELPSTKSNGDSARHMPSLFVPLDIGNGNENIPKVSSNFKNGLAYCPPAAPDNFELQIPDNFAVEENIKPELNSNPDLPKPIEDLDTKDIVNSEKIVAKTKIPEQTEANSLEDLPEPIEDLPESIDDLDTKGIVNSEEPVAKTKIPEQTEANSLESVAETEKNNPIPINIDFEELGQSLLDVVSESTGYPVEMLELEMDMEADLGIDSIKRVEILGALQERYPDLPQPNLEELAEIELRTLSQIIAYMRTLVSEREKKNSVPSLSN